MKKIISILAMSVAACIAQADEIDELKELAELSQWGAENIVFKMECEAPAELWKARIYVYPNTYVWYRWQDYEKASDFEKPAIFQELKTLTK